MLRRDLVCVADVCLQLGGGSSTMVNRDLIEVC